MQKQDSAQFIQVGCMRCKKTPENQKLAEAGQKTMEYVFDEAFSVIQGLAKDYLNIEVKEELHAKLIAWGEEQGLFFKEEEKK